LPIIYVIISESIGFSVNLTILVKYNIFFNVVNNNGILYSEDYNLDFNCPIILRILTPLGKTILLSSTNLLLKSGKYKVSILIF